MQIINLTPHTVVVAADFNSSRVEFPSEGVARVSTSSVATGVVNGIEVVTTTYGEVEGLPEPQEGVVYLVSMVVGQVPAIKLRPDVLCPDTSPAACVRYPNGYIVGGTMEGGVKVGGKDMSGMIYAVTRFTKY